MDGGETSSFIHPIITGALGSDPALVKGRDGGLEGGANSFF